MTTRRFEKGQIIFREGEESTDAYFVLSGKVLIRVRTPQGACTLAELGPGEVFGEMGMIEDAPRSATAEAAERTELEVINERDFAESIMARPARLSRYLATLFERLRHASSLVRAHAAVSARAAGPGADPASIPRLRVSIASRYDETGFPGTPVKVTVPKLPYLIGRDAGEAGGPFSFNDLGLVDRAPYQVSRHHCALEQRSDRIVVRDRGSTVGTVVNGKPIGVRFLGTEAELEPGTNDVRLGTADSPHRLAVTVEIEPA
jgi:CRP/FNR family transcriptional regulator, cyclic AMP receptor protein